jgi:hypothetical protein
LIGAEVGPRADFSVAEHSMLQFPGGRGRQLLLEGRHTHDGFTRLWQEGMLEYSVEAVLLKPRYMCLFTERERAIARERLRLHDFDVDGYLTRW